VHLADRAIQHSVLALFSGIWHKVNAPDQRPADSTPERNEIDALRERAERAERKGEPLRREIERLRREKDRLREELEAARRLSASGAIFEESGPRPAGSGGVVLPA